MSKVDSIRKLIQQHRGQFIGVEFVKKDGTVRKMVGQHCYKEGHSGVNTTAHIDKYFTLVENKQDGSGDIGNGKSSFQYRNINLETVKRLKIAGVEYNFE